MAELFSLPKDYWIEDANEVRNFMETQVNLSEIKELKTPHLIIYSTYFIVEISGGFRFANSDQSRDGRPRKKNQSYLESLPYCDFFKFYCAVLFSFLFLIYSPFRKTSVSKLGVKQTTYSNYY